MNPVTLSAPEIAGLVRRQSPRPLQPAELAMLTAIVQRESGGRTDAKRLASANPLGGNDLGLFQINDKANQLGDIQRALAFNAFWNVNYALQLATRGVLTGLDLSPWGGPNTSPAKTLAGGYENSHPLTPGAAAVDAAANPVDPSDRLIKAGHSPNAIPTPEELKQLGEAGGSAMQVVDSAGNAIANALTPDWLASLGRLLANLLNPAWWRRLGLGALGLLLVVIAVALTAASAKLRS